ncbi:TetR/AcrR family transcriptional regulator [Streptomyces sp. NPDC049936]|uniref:TetR/AcrR family transcriptional regulator n=1 Tax=Streptomyces sp. NPDC049936 TaxID=3365599 RepID=UPI003790DEC7
MTRGRAEHAPTAGTARARLLASADELFYGEGVQSVGIDRVIEHSGVAKATLYRLFGSKEHLVAAYLAERHARNLAELGKAVERHADPVEALLAVFGTQARWLKRRTYRGCAFARATAEPSAGQAVQQAAEAYRAAVRSLLLRLATDAGAEDPRVLAAQLHTLYHGAEVLAVGGRGSGPIDAVRAAARSLIEAALPVADS